MTRRRIVDRATGEVVAELDDAAASADAAGPSTEGRPATGSGVVVESRPGADLDSTVVEVVNDGWRFVFDVVDADRADLRARATRRRATGTTDGPTQVRAIIPGRVVAVAVQPGDDVAAGDRLLAVEAMKMENEVRAPRAGRVERVSVAAGQTVELGDVLVVLA